MKWRLDKITRDVAREPYYSIRAARPNLATRAAKSRARARARDSVQIFRNIRVSKRARAREEDADCVNLRLSVCRRVSDRFYWLRVMLTPPPPRRPSDEIFRGGTRARFRGRNHPQVSRRAP